MRFNEVLVNERKKRGLSQEELAEKVQVSRQSVSKWETGDAMPDLNKLMLIADALEMSLDELCGRTEYIKKDVVKEPEKAKKSSYTAVVVIIILIIHVAGFMYTMQKNKETQAFYEKQFEALTDDFTVTGTEFFGESRNVLRYRFVPSISGYELKYKITFADVDGNAYVFDAVNNGGVCTGTANLGDNYGGYNVSVSVVSGELSRNVAVAYNLCFNEGSSSWNPITD